jgi:hypothetical protein
MKMNHHCEYIFLKRKHQCILNHARLLEWILGAHMEATLL